MGNIFLDFAKQTSYQKVVRDGLNVFRDLRLVKNRGHIHLIHMNLIPLAAESQVCRKAIHRFFVIQINLCADCSRGHSAIHRSGIE